MFNFGKKNKSTTLLMPFTGRVIPLEEVPDQVFSKKMVGDGFAIVPTETFSVLKSPCNGQLIQVFKTNHAVGITSEEGLELIVHVGIDTVELGGTGFERLIESPAALTPDTSILNISFDVLKAHGKSLVTPIIVTNMGVVKSIDVSYGTFKSGVPIAKITLK